MKNTFRNETEDIVVIASSTFLLLLHLFRNNLFYNLCKDEMNLRKATTKGPKKPYLGITVVAIYLLRLRNAGDRKQFLKTCRAKTNECESCPLA